MCFEIWAKKTSFSKRKNKNAPHFNCGILTNFGKGEYVVIILVQQFIQDENNICEV